MSLPQGNRGPAVTPDQAAFNAHTERFEAFLANTNQKLVTHQAAIEGMQKRAPSAWARLKDPTQPFTILYVGAGNGGIEIPLTGSLMAERDSLANVKVYCEDPSNEMAAEFLDKLDASGRPLPDRLFTPALMGGYMVQKFEDPAFTPPEGVDFALASQAWYYVNGWQDGGNEADQNSLVKFADAVLPRGLGLITLQSAASDRTNMRDNFISLTDSHEVELAGEIVHAAMRKAGIPVEISTIVSQTSVEDCFRDGVFSPNQVGKQLLSFILRADWDALSRDIQDPIADQLTRMTEINGGQHMRFVDTALWVVDRSAAEN